MTTVIHPSSRNIPPGPQTSFFVGNAPDMRRDQLQFYLDLRKQFGDVVRFRAIGPLFGYMVFHPDGIDHILRVNNQNYHKGFALQQLRPMIGNENLLIAEGSSWLKQRRLAQPAFHRQRIAAFAPIMTGAAESMIERWHTYEKEALIFDVSAEMMGVTLQIAAKTLFNTDVEGESNEIGRAFTAVLAHINYNTSHLFALPDWVPSVRNRRFAEALRLLDTFVYTIIQERRQKEQDVGDLLSMFLLARDQETGERMSDRQLHDEVMTMVLAGHETTANALTWTWYLLSQHTDVEHELHEELDAVLGGRTPTLADLARLPYTKMVIDEALRLYPPASGVSRRALADDEISGYYIPGGAEIGIVQYVTHRHPDFWERPEEFDPEHFTPERVAKRPHFAYFPFGGGPRLCIGNAFALMEAQLILATVAQVYRVRAIPDHPVVPETLVTLRPRNGIFVTLQRR